jgi:DNA-binding PadR family transcriptional regulator
LISGIASLLLVGHWQIYSDSEYRQEVTDSLTTTSYAILALLALQEWSSYELAQQMGRSVDWFWPRAESVVYEEPKRLVRLGLAKIGRASCRERV